MKLNLTDILNINFSEAYNIEGLSSSSLNGVSTDSRTIKKGEIFFAIRGEKVNGHDYIAAAINAGAAALVVDSKFYEKKFWENSGSIVFSKPVIVVENTVKALGELANIYRKKFNIPVIAVAGSNGKTTAKDMIARVLSEKYNVLSTQGNLNNHIGVPLTLFRLNHKHDIAVVEIGTNHFGEIKYLCEILEPTHGLITNIHNEHLEFFGDINGVAKEEGYLFKYRAEKKSKSVGFVNTDDKRVVSLSKNLKNRVFYGTKENKADITGINLSVNSDGKFAFELISNSHKNSLKLKLAVAGKHNVSNALAASAIGLYFNVPVTKIKKAIETFKPVNKRMEIVKAGKVTIINDTYNANADSVLSALKTLELIQTQGNKIIVLGDMLELGNQSKQQHTLVGEAITKFASSSDVTVHLLTYGKQSRQIYKSANLKNKSHYSDKKALCENVAKIVAENDIVLVKGSRGMRMEDIVTYLTEKL
ncbi:MAG: UDP-N-acetylmuramoyl-tripeptide--D-alanyl-D-alanine ligase [Bacteroidetes bacterium]|nr:UDP-N-acetylmuramoyl-tripeptide--D-alanyl-D-alanine ligase [Bacteroidota bacterium]MBU1421830.1 UDP-N-acetylmuramoyl-tripeptide--D-alanyl-D-alanine ligase [Bacteroidota bacterium]